MNKPKQVIVMRKDLNMRKGKMAAQAAHASMAVLINAGKYSPTLDADGESFGTRFVLTMDTNSPLREWLLDTFTKVCVSVNSEQELLDVVAAAKQAGVLNAMITDNGLTEFHGVPTNTCAAIGPDYSERIDRITGHFPLL